MNDQFALFGSGLETLETSAVTFTAARLQPLHRWFPYLEGYAPEFVLALYSRFMPNATRVLEPFAGSGTTGLTLAAIDVACGYCEVNPVMRLVIETKLAVCELPPKRARALAADVLDLSSKLTALVRASERDIALENSYAACFGASKFFEPESLDQVLRLRTLATATEKQDELLGRVLQVAVMSQLVLCSLLKRAGDVRFKTPKELAKGVPPLVPSVQRQLVLMAADCAECPRLKRLVTPLCADSKDLEYLPSYEAQGVITSPPYLNGTNYIRNTKLELWFLRLISDGRGLRTLRNAVVTSGINDVSVNTNTDPVTESVSSVVAEVERNAYDVRIPKMVAGYFSDMAKVLRGLMRHTTKGAAICIDIGDSRFGGVHIPTQKLLVDVAQECGFSHDQTIRLRSRIAKDRTVLSQDLIVLRHPQVAKLTTRRSGPDWRSRWDAFKRTLPHQQGDFTKRNWGHPLHSLCSYQGKMKPSLAHHLVQCFTSPGDTVIDPFSGAGTIPFEAAIAGRKAFALDLSTMATAVTTAKLRRVGPQALSDLLDELEKWIGAYKVRQQELDGASAVRFNRSIPEYFHEDTLREVLAARAFFAARRDDSPEWAMALSAMLHILHGNRPYALSRRSHPITPFAPTGPYEYRSVMSRLRDKVARSVDTELPEEFVPGMCWQADILKPWPKPIAELDAVITSPPFFDSTRFYMSNWMRYWFCGWDLAEFDTEPMRFVETAQKKSLKVYSVIFERFAERMKAGGIVALHLGASRKCDMAKELALLAEPAFSVADIFSEDVGHCEKHGVSDKGTVHSHQYLILARN